jgi:hypothetical protein
MKRDWSARGLADRATSKMEAAMHFRRTGVVRYIHSVSPPGDDVHNVDTFSGGF